MFRKLTDWALSLLDSSREMSEHRVRLKHLEERVRDLEEGMRVMSQQFQHGRELDVGEREKLLLKIEGIVAKGQLPPPKRRRGKSR